MNRTWKCPKCRKTRRLSYEEVVEVGTPHCPACDDTEMELQPAKPIETIVEVSGGCLRSVYASSPLSVSLLDWDNVRDGDATADERKAAKELEQRARKLKAVW